MADGDSFPILNRGTRNQARRKTCHHCTNALKKRGRDERGIGLAQPRPPVELQTSKYRHWSVQDDRYLRENIGGGDYEAIAGALGRSLHSVYTRRRILGLAAVRKSHRVAKPWSIQRP